MGGGRRLLAAAEVRELRAVLGQREVGGRARAFQPHLQSGRGRSAATACTPRASPAGPLQAAPSTKMPARSLLAMCRIQPKPLCAAGRASGCWCRCCWQRERCARQHCSSQPARAGQTLEDAHGLQEDGAEVGGEGRQPAQSRRRARRCPPSRAGPGRCAWSRARRCATPSGLQEQAPAVSSGACGSRRGSVATAAAQESAPASMPGPEAGSWQPELLAPGGLVCGSR